MTTTVENATEPGSAAGPVPRRLPVGAELLPGGAGVAFRVWAPKRKRVAVVLEAGAGGTGSSTGTGGPPDPLDLAPEPDGYFAGVAPAARAGTRYRYRLDAEDYLYPDPVSRYQPDGPHGPSEVVDPAAFRWTDDAWPGIGPAGQVLYEMHIGTFTKEGTWAAAAERLADLKELGVTCLEVMPVNEFAGRWGWGYDGVALFAPYHHYGTPDDARRFVDRAHALGMAVILDLVYNHLGPDGNYLKAYADTYFSATHSTDWGEALNFDGPGSHGTREYFLSNARYWVEEFHFDGYRFDATQAIVDDSPKHVLAEITETARRAAGKRSVYLINENEPQHTKLVRPIDAGGYGMDALWNDDFHHSALVALAGHNEAYYTDYLGSAQEMLSSAKWGYLYQGQRYKWQRKRRGTPALDLPPTAFVHFLQNHDQVANSGRGFRAHQIAGPGHLKAVTALMLLMPQTPMLFQGQEWAACCTFHYFADHNPELNQLIKAGRAKEIGQFPSAATTEMEPFLVDPGAEETFNRSKLNHAEKTAPPHAEMLRFHTDLLRLRREDPTFRRVQRRGDLDGAVIGPDALVLRYFGSNDDYSADRLLVVNLGRDLALDPAPEPLLAAPLGMRWATVWSSEDPRYGGSGTPPVDTELEGWFVLGRSAVVCKPLPAEEATVATRVRHAGSAQEAKVKEQVLDAAREGEKDREQAG
ncbi:MAG: GH13_10 / GH13 / GH13_9 / GH13_11 / GH13 _8 / GH13_36 / GH13_37 [uncultured Phycisphaerae bacterium]|uniref:Malto-oligosyltrehalose trehalohydrolase n=1 Tax=uncultured Phycisphaerae bacterium TaxID=904963 RepID=A0A6J4PBJ7_9BACT|nr:MAG: GH13_10 / GH13 / GH13_9 / GH13_11 / GH13 _8 / GH13_36 / GH13_37 [uncultured Phycisphaerae bacterium]